MLDPLQCGLPRLLQLSRDQAIIRIACGIAAFGQRGIVLSLGQLQLGNPQPILSLLFQHPLGLLGGLDRQR